MSGFTICDLRLTRRNAELRFGAFGIALRKPPQERGIYAASTPEIRAASYLDSLRASIRTMKRHKCRAPLLSSAPHVVGVRIA